MKFDIRRNVLAKNFHIADVRKSSSIAYTSVCPKKVYHGKAKVNSGEVPVNRNQSIVNVISK
jgi:cytochrome c-type biogenesis protein CcmE